MRKELLIATNEYKLKISKLKFIYLSIHMSFLFNYSFAVIMLTKLTKT